MKPPRNYILSLTCTPQGPPPFDPTPLLPTDPVSLGNSEDGDTGILTGGVPSPCTAYHLKFDLEPGDPLVIGNNIALTHVPTIPALDPVGLALLGGLIALLGIAVLGGRRLMG